MLLKLVFLLALSWVQGDRIPGSRPGQCPLVAPGTIGTCLVSCMGDESCPQGQKCCSNGCGRTCQVAVAGEGCVCGQPCTMTGGGSGVCQADSKTCAVNIQAPQCGGSPHAGQCPALAAGTVGICIHACSGDSACAADEKCCSNGCGRTCQKAVTNSGCVCGQPCTMASGGSGVCQEDRKTCAVNIQAPQCDRRGCICGQPCTMASGGSGVCQADRQTCAVNIQAPQCNPPTSCVCGQPCVMAGGGSGVCQEDRKTCAVNIQAPQCNRGCICGQPCTMAGGGSGVCQTDNMTCAVNIMAPQCGKGKGKGAQATCSSSAECRGNQKCVNGSCKPLGRTCRKACPSGQRCVNGVCTAY